MGLFSKTKKEDAVVGDNKNFIEAIQRQLDTGALIYLEECQDFNTNSVVTVAPNAQALFIKNGELMGILPPGRHELKSDNIPFFSKLRNMLSGGVSTFTCQIYHVNTSEQKINWGTSSAIEIQDFFLGGGVIGVPTSIRGAGSFRVRFDVLNDPTASAQTYMRLMGDKSLFTVNDLSRLFQAQLSQEISSCIGQALETRSRKESINAVSSQLKEFARQLTNEFNELFQTYGLSLVNFSFLNLQIDETEERKKYLDRLIATAHTGSYDKAVQQELLKDISSKSDGGDIAGLGAGLAAGLASGSAFMNMASSTFNPPPQSSTSAVSDPVQALSTMKQLLEKNLISQEQYDTKVQEILKRL